MTHVPPHAPSAGQIEQQLADSGLQVAVEASDGSLILSGMVDSEEARQAAEDIVAQLAPRARIDNQLEIQTVLPTNVDDFESDGPTSELEDSTALVQSGQGEIEADFARPSALVDPLAAPGGPDDSPDDPAAEGEVYTPPNDPVVTTDARGNTQMLGGFGRGEDDDGVAVEVSSDGTLGDEGLADAVRRELAEDSATTDLRILVVVRQGVVHLRGQVADLDDADNAESVAARVPGVREVVEELEVVNV